MHGEHAAQVDHLEHVEAQIAEVIVDRLRQFFARERRNPRAILAAPRPDLGDDDEIIGIRVERFADELVRDVRAVEVARVDVVHPTRDGLAKHGQRRAMVLGRAEHARSGELHGTVTEPLHGAVAEGERAGLVDAGHGHGGVPGTWWNVLILSRAGNGLNTGIHLLPAYSCAAAFQVAHESASPFSRAYARRFRAAPMPLARPRPDDDRR